MLALAAPAPLPRVRHVAFTCADRNALVAWHEALTAKDVVPGTITDAPYGSGFVVRDPDGLELEAVRPTQRLGRVTKVAECGLGVSRA